MPTCVTRYGGYEGNIGWQDEAVCGDPDIGTTYTADDTFSGGPTHTTTNTWVTNPAPAWVVDSLIGYEMWVLTGAQAGEHAVISANGADNITHAAITAPVADLDTIRLVPPLETFGFVQSVEFNVNKEMVSARMIGDQRVQHQERAKESPDVAIETIPSVSVLQAEVKAILGDTAAPYTWQPHMTTRTIERGLVRASPAGEQREYLNMAKMDTLSGEVSEGDYLTLSMTYKGQSIRHSTSKAYVDIEGNDKYIGPDAADPTKGDYDPIIFSDCELTLMRYTEETGNHVGAGNTFVTTTVAADVDGTATYIEYVWQWTDEVWNECTNYVPGTRTATFADAWLGGEAYVIVYWIDLVVTDYTDFSWEVNRNCEHQHGIIATTGIWAYEILEGSADFSISMTINFADATELDHLIADEYCHMKLTIKPGAADETVLRWLFFKFTGPAPPYSAEDLVSVDLEGEPENFRMD